VSKRGNLFVLEGPDGVGKSTLARALTERLNSSGIMCDLVAFPGHEAETLGRHIYALHHNSAQFEVQTIHPTSLQVLHIAAHIDTLEGHILPALEGGRSVVLDRFWWSTWVYGKISGANRRALEAMLDVEFAHWDKLVPDAVFLLKRSAPFQKDGAGNTWNTLSVAYDELAREQKQRFPVYLIKNDGGIEKALNQIMKKIASSEANRLSKDLLGMEEGSRVPLRSPTNMAFSLETHKKIRQPFAATIFTNISPAEPTEVFDTYWRFAVERQEMFFKRWEGAVPPWTTDPILSKYKFTNVYRASDRVSQYLIREVIYHGDQSPEEVFFRIMLFKIFNHIKTWELLKQHFGEVQYADYSFEHYDAVLSEAINGGRTIFSAAYIMPSGVSSFGYSKKHRNYLRLLELMLKDEVPLRLTEMRSMHQAFNLLRSYPLMGDFLAYQYVIDINYSQLTNFSEMDFVVPGPGARDGVRKCFHSLGGLNEADTIRLMASRQEEEFSRLGLTFRSLWGRPLQLIDCQNLFCEVDKYARMAHPNVKGISDRKRIKQIYQAKTQQIEYWYPPKWKINHLIKRGMGDDQSD
jgi:thymidylate kinase